MLSDTRAQGYVVGAITMLIATIIALSIVLASVIEVMELSLDGYHTSTPSSPVQATVTPAVTSTPVQNVGDPIKTTNLNIHAEKTNVMVGEDILIKLSAVNLITKKTMHIQVILVPPSGMSVSSSTFVFSGAGQYTSDFRVEPGQGRDIEISLLPNQAGNFNIEGRAVYYFGDDIINSEDYRISVPVHVGANLAITSVVATESQSVKLVDIVANSTAGDVLMQLALLMIVIVLLSTIALMGMSK